MHVCFSSSTILMKVSYMPSCSHPVAVEIIPFWKKFKKNAYITLINIRKKRNIVGAPAPSILLCISSVCFVFYDIMYFSIIQLFYFFYMWSFFNHHWRARVYTMPCSIFLLVVKEYIRLKFKTNFSILYQLIKLIQIFCEYYFLNRLLEK